MSSSTKPSTADRVNNIIVLSGIIMLWLIGAINIFTNQAAQGVGFMLVAVILLRIFVWLERLKLRNVQRLQN